MSRTDTSYRGRFAPSPTGPMHMGSLIAALASYLDARHYHGEWLVRIEDLDPPREMAGSANLILKSLERHGLHWDGEPLWQSNREAAYEQALLALEQQGLLFHCDCTRQKLGPNGSCRGHCLPRQAEVGQPCALRVRVPDDTALQIEDLWQGQQQSLLGQGTADFTVKRKDSLYAYQLAVVVDDASQGITHIIRGSDILDSTPRQLFLQNALGYPNPHYGHLPVICNAEGQKLSKQNHAAPLDDDRACDNLRYALAFLQQPVPDDIEDPVALVSRAAADWSRQRVPRVMTIEQH